jgi:NTP pyrophosphatase (non-canonical NTP hydrolase)
MNDADEYQQAALRTAGVPPAAEKEKARLTMCALGVTGESGEFADAIKKWIFHGHELDQEKAMIELSDICWYIAVAADTLGYSLSEVFEKNIAKLKRRYPDGFSEAASVNRSE